MDINNFSEFGGIQNVQRVIENILASKKQITSKIKDLRSVTLEPLDTIALYRCCFSDNSFSKKKMTLALSITEQSIMDVSNNLKSLDLMDMDLNWLLVALKKQQKGYLEQMQSINFIQNAKQKNNFSFMPFALEQLCSALQKVASSQDEIIYGLKLLNEPENDYLN